MSNKAWLWLGVFISGGNFLLASVALLQGDLFLFLLGVCVGFFVAKPLWDVRAEFERGTNDTEG